MLKPSNNKISTNFPLVVPPQRKAYLSSTIITSLTYHLIEEKENGYAITMLKPSNDKVQTFLWSFQLYARPTWAGPLIRRLYLLTLTPGLKRKRAYPKDIENFVYFLLTVVKQSVIETQVLCFLLLFTYEHAHPFLSHLKHTPTFKLVTAVAQKNSKTFNQIRV